MSLAVFIFVLVGVGFPPPDGLLRGVDIARKRVDTFDATLSIETMSPEKSVALCRVEQSGIKRRFEILEGSFRQQVIVKEGDAITGFIRADGQEVELYSIDRAVGQRGDIVFDPRLLGLSNLMSAKTTVEKCLWYERFDTLENLGMVSVEGAEGTVWKVVATRGNAESEYWIEEPSFRVHKRVIRTNRTATVIDSFFERELGNNALPSRVVIYSKSEEISPIRKEILLSVFEEKSSIADDRFALMSMDIPLNTVVSDYDASRRLGYWNGESIDPQPTYVPPGPPKSSAAFPSVIALGVLAIVGFIVWRKVRSR